MLELALRRCRRAAVFLIALAAAAHGGRASERAALPLQEDPAPARDGPRRDTPRKAVLGFLEASRENDFERAARYLDLQDVPEAPAKSASELARQLHVVLDRTLWVSLDALSDDPAGNPDDGLPPGFDLVGKIPTRRGEAEIRVQALAEGDATVWKISADTVARIPALYDEFGYGALGELLPPILLEVRFLEIVLWQWIGLLVLLIVAWGVAWLAANVVVRLLAPLTRRTRTDLDDRLIGLLLGPLRLIAGLAAFAAGVVALRLAVPAQQFFSSAEMLLAVFAVTWLFWRVVDLFAGVLQEKLRAGGRTAAANLLPLGSKTLKLALAAMALLATLDSIGFDVTAVIAGLGIGGLAVALAAQKTIENFFGGVSLLLDQPVRPGDFCRFGDKVGTVEEVGLRSTRVRTLDRTVISVPNADFSTMQLENFAKRDRFWFQTTLGLRYATTPDQLRKVLLDLRELLVAHPKVIPDPARVRFVAFGAYSLDLEIFTYVAAADMNEFLAIREDLYLRMMDVIAAAGTGFAFPSQTTYLARDSGNDEERTRAAEERVAEMRAKGELMFPDFTPEHVARVERKLAYPPEGAPAR
jgi:MscS family membrane protein